MQYSVAVGPRSKRRWCLVQFFTAAVIALGIPIHTCLAGPTYQSGRINNVTFAGDAILIKLDSGLPDNCTGTSYGWMIIPAAYKPLHAFVLGLWLRGDAAQTTMMVYTSAGLVGGYCQIDQIDPDG